VTLADVSKPPERVESAGRWFASALVIFLLALVWLFHGVLFDGFGDRVTTSTLTHTPGVAHTLEDLPKEGSLSHTDQRFVIWLTARNSATLLSRPHRFFDAEPCYPAERALTFGEPGLTLGLVGLPAWLLTGNPVATFNWVVLVLVLAAALAMYWLIVEWTGVPAAGIVAALAFAYSDIRIGDVVHVNVYDNAWTVFSILFATRLFTRRHWLDAIGLAVSIVLQIGTSLYPLVGAMLVALPISIWLLVVASIIAVGLFLFPPYLSARASEGLRGQDIQAFLPLGYAAPWGGGFLGLGVWGLAIVGLVMRRDLAPRPGLGNPRWALLAAIVLAMSMTMVPGAGAQPVMLESSEAGPFLYRLASSLLPGLDVVRAPGAVYFVAQLCACALMGLGMATLYRALPPRWSHWLFGVVLLLTAVEVMHPELFGLGPRVRYGTLHMTPHTDDLALLAGLELEADSGNGRASALLEIPMVPMDLDSSSLRLLHSAYHRHRTSACYNSSRYREDVLKLARRLPAPDALLEARGLGFSHVVLHHRRVNPIVDVLLERFADRATTEGPLGVEKVGESDRMTVYRIRP